MRRHDSLKQMRITLVMAVLCCLLIDVDGLYVWAERLKVGSVRNVVLPAVSVWRGWLEPWHLNQLRSEMMSARAALDFPKIQEHRLEQMEKKSIDSWLEEQTSDFQIPVSINTAIADGLAYGRGESSVSPVELLSKSASPVSGKTDLVLVALAGDSMMAVGLAPSLHRDKLSQNDFHFIKAYRSGTGLSRPEIFDWLRQYPTMLAGKRPQFVICAIGANDAQNVQVGKKILTFASPEWDDYYRARLAAYLTMIEAPGTKILWVGMPLMKDHRFSLKMQHLNKVIRAEIALHSSVTWLDPNPELGYSGLQFVQYRTNVRGKLIKMRADDGIHMTDDGAAYLLPSIREWLERYVKSGKGTSVPSAAEPTVDASSPIA